MDESYRPFVLLAMVFLALGFALVALPLLAKVMPADLKIPKFITSTTGTTSTSQPRPC